MDLSSKYGLFIDDVPEMRSTVRIQMADAGLEKCDVVRNIKEAMDKLAGRKYDIILCDYNLGQGTDGQQFLEMLRRRKMLPLSVAFIMITGESSYEHVATAAEYAPDDYLLKPFTAETLRQRLERVFDRKAALAPIYRELARPGHRHQALAACDELLAAKTRYSLDVLRQKGELLLAMHRTDEALALYQEVLKQRSTPWAEVGKARALIANGHEEAARSELELALEAYPNYLAAYDTLAAVVEKHDKATAQRIVERALSVAPSTQRQRHIGALALENRDFARAETAFRRAVDKDRSGFFKEHGDYAGLAKAYAEQGKTREALTAARNMSQHFPRTPELVARQAAVESQVHARSGNAALAQAAMETALATMRTADLDPDTSLEVAQACFVTGKREQATEIIRSVAEEHHDDDRIFAGALDVFTAAGMAEEGSALLDETRRRMIRLNNDAVGLAKSGHLNEAIAMLRTAADRLPHNAQIAINAAAAMMMRMQEKGTDVGQLALARRYLKRARNIDADHPQLDDAEAFYQKLSPETYDAA